MTECEQEQSVEGCEEEQNVEKCEEKQSVNTEGINIIKYDDTLLDTRTFDTQAVNQLSPYAGFRLPPLQVHMLNTFCYIYIDFGKLTVQNIHIAITRN